MKEKQTLIPNPFTSMWRGLIKSSPLRGEVRGGLLFFFFILLGSCAPPLPSGILDEDKMTDVLVDIHLAQGMAEAKSEDIDATRYKYLQAVFKKHRITEAEFDSSMVYYSGRAEDFKLIYDNVVTRVRAQAERMGLEAAAQDKFASLTSEGDTANIWLGKDFACIVPNKVQCVYSFQMKADSTFRPGDSFIWRFKTQFVARSMNNEAIALLNFYYDTDTVATISELLRNSPKNELRHTPSKELDSLNLRSISGFIYLPPVNSADPPKPLLASEIKLIRMHKQEPIPNPASDTQTDSLAADTLVLDTMPLQKGERLTPLQVRESQPKERKIRVVKENPNPIHPDRGIPQRTNRRRK
ncbi:MAG: DUF4296 domain-containing protein [Bacteroidaceae bacterium]|nr:DUF4296 domain-containing protein [Bacteroidaceae bacterium]